jgi:Dyp-type peroxidase family
VSREQHDTQGNILRGYTHLSQVEYLFERIGDRDRARELLAELLTEVTTDEEWAEKAGVRRTLNIAFTHGGLAKLGHGQPFEAPEFADFREGMQARARECLADCGDNDPDRWEPGLREAADLLVTMYWDGSEGERSGLEALRDRLAAAGMHEVYRQRADTLKGHREQFGFTDGFSQPVVEPGNAQNPQGEGVLEPWNPLALRLRSRWRPVRLGEFLLGHLDEDDVVPGAGDPRLRNGTFMVWRKLRQDVERFEQFFERAAGGGPDRRASLESRAVGRWRDGTSLIDAPRRPARSAGERPANNAFVYGRDPAGVSCPIGAHVRRANPRDGLGWWTHRTRRHRIIRRGVPYEDDDGSRGLVFVCFNASISRQFELIQGRWLMDGDAFGLGADQDFLLGRGKLTVQGDRRRPASYLPAPERQFVTTRGGYYLFVPGIDSLRRIAGR